jgi:hypothetical protein
MDSGRQRLTRRDAGEPLACCQAVCWGGCVAGMTSTTLPASRCLSTCGSLNSLAGMITTGFSGSYDL